MRASPSRQAVATLNRPREAQFHAGPHIARTGFSSALSLPRHLCTAQEHRPPNHMRLYFEYHVRRQGGKRLPIDHCWVTVVNCGAKTIRRRKQLKMPWRPGQLSAKRLLLSLIAPRTRLTKGAKMFAPTPRPPTMFSPFSVPSTFLNLPPPAGGSNGRVDGGKPAQ